MFANGSTYVGTGVLIDGENVLTNAHNLYNKDSVHVYPGYAKSLKAPFGVLKVICKLDSTVFMTDAYLAAPKTSAEDYAILKVQGKEVYDRIYQHSDDRKINFQQMDPPTETLNISGYPCFKFWEFWRPRKCQYCYQNQTRKYTLTQNDVIMYRLNTRKGSSGSPLYIIEDGRYYLIGIHKSGQGFSNQGVFYNEERYHTIQGWINQ